MHVSAFAPGLGGLKWLNVTPICWLPLQTLPSRIASGHKRHGFGLLHLNRLFQRVWKRHRFHVAPIDLYLIISVVILLLRLSLSRWQFRQISLRLARVFSGVTRCGRWLNYMIYRAIICQISGPSVYIIYSSAFMASWISITRSPSPAIKCREAGMTPTPEGSLMAQLDLPHLCKSESTIGIIKTCG